MKKFAFAFVTLALCALCLFGCDDLLGGGDPLDPVIPDYNQDIEAVAPDNIETEHFVKEEDKTYYKSEGLSLWMSVNGEFLKMDYFSLEGKKRVYDNLYFYADDYFYMVTDDVRYLYVALKGGADTEYAQVERQDGEDVQVNIVKTGIYRLIFDCETLEFDLQFKSEIETPVYYTMKTCSIFSLATDWIEMEKSTENPDEFYINNFTVENGKHISFFSNIHTSNYKVTLDSSTDGKYADARKTAITMKVGGTYNIFVNSKTYEARLELVNPDTADYGCIYYDGTDFIELEPRETEPYIFVQRLTVDAIDSLPDFYSLSYREFKLDAESEHLSKTGKSYYFKKAGTYDIIINLRDFEITVEKLPE